MPEQQNALAQWRVQAMPNIARLLPGCGIELLLPEAYYVACREADKQIRPALIRAAVHYLTHTLGTEPQDLSAIIGGFGEESIDNRVDEYRVSFALRQHPDVVYGIVWPLYGQEDAEAELRGLSTGLLAQAGNSAKAAVHSLRSDYAAPVDEKTRRALRALGYIGAHEPGRRPAQSARGRTRLEFRQGAQPRSGGVEWGSFLHHN